MTLSSSFGNRKSSILRHVVLDDRKRHVLTRPKEQEKGSAKEQTQLVKIKESGTKKRKLPIVSRRLNTSSADNQFSKKNHSGR